MPQPLQARHLSSRERPVVTHTPTARVVVPERVKDVVPSDFVRDANFVLGKLAGDWAMVVVEPHVGWRRDGQPAYVMPKWTFTCEDPAGKPCQVMVYLSFRNMDRYASADPHLGQLFDQLVGVVTGRDQQYLESEALSWATRPFGKQIMRSRRLTQEEHDQRNMELAQKPRE